MEKYIRELIEDLGAKKYKRGIDWNGYRVYIPQYKGNPIIGHPYVVLEKACENFKANYKGDINKFDLDKDGYFDAVWVMYINPYVDDDTTSWYKLYDKNFYNTSYYNE